MNFKPIYYICVACPTIDRTLEMVDQYVAHGARALQIDMPSKDPYAETPLVKAMMATSLVQYQGYDEYMNALREMRRRHPDLELHVVVYHDVVESIGLERFVAFGKEINVASFLIPNNTEETSQYIERNGIVDMKIIVHAMPEHEIRSCVQAGKNGISGIVAIRNQKPDEVSTPGLETYGKKYAYLQERGVTSPIYSVFGIQTAEELFAVKQVGSAGAIIGNVLMNLWDQPDALWKRFAELNALADYSL